MSKIADALKKIGQQGNDTISPIGERNTFSENYKIGGKMRRSWLIWVFIVGVVTVFAIFNYQEGKDAVPLSEIFPDEDVLSVDVAYEFVDDQVAPSVAKEALPVAQQAKVAAPVVTPVKKVVSVEPAPVKKEANYTVQIASFKDKKRAEESLADIKIKVPSAYIAARNLGEKGIWYRVYAGQFELRSEAEVTLSDIKKNFDSSFIISSKSAN